ncbi:MAG: hypothetical protein JRN68_10285 [Nitrososphaerota archaeon]|nr:hypothetical protein [Nitrososphaerota archaeon]
MKKDAASLHGSATGILFCSVILRLSREKGDLICLHLIERAKVKAILFELNPSKLLDLCAVAGVAIPASTKDPDFISEKIISEIDEGKTAYESVLRLAQYLRISPKIENPSSGLNKQDFAKLLGLQIEGLKKTSRQELIGAMRRRIYDGGIDISQIELQSDVLLRRRIQRISKPEARAIIANRLLGSDLADIATTDLSELLLSKLKSGELAEQDIENLIREAQRETQLARKRTFEGVSNQQLASRLDAIVQDIHEMRQTLKKLEEQRMAGFYRQFRSSSERDISGFLKNLHFASRSFNGLSEDKLYGIVTELEKRGYNFQQIIEQAEVVTFLQECQKISESIEFAITLEDFFAALRASVKDISRSRTPAIYEVRDSLTALLNITRPVFIHRLLECRTLGWIRLIEGSPPSESEDRWLDIDGRRYFYIELTGARG